MKIIVSENALRNVELGGTLKLLYLIVKRMFSLNGCFKDGSFAGSGSHNIVNTC